MRKQLLTALLITCVVACSFAQASDSFFVKTDTTSLKNKYRIKATSFIVPAVFLGYGVISLTGDNVIRRLDYSTNGELQEDHPSFAFKADDYLRYAPVIAIYGLDLLGVKARHKVMDRTAMLLMSAAISQLSVAALKNGVKRERPNQQGTVSFPSGHTSLAFMTAEFLHQEYKNRSIWYSVGGYAIASGTGVLRLYNNDHWVSDVVAAAGIGMASTKLTYLIYPYLKKKIFRNKVADVLFAPGYQNGRVGFNFVTRF